MAMMVQHNLSAMNANRQLGITTGQQAKSSEKLSSGYKINRAADNAAGLTISEKMRGQVRGLNKASENAQNGISMIQTAEGALNETSSMIQRMRELTVQAANDTNVTADRTAIQKEIKALQDEIDRVADQTEFNTQKLLNGDCDNKNLQVGANKDQNIAFKISEMTANALGIDGIDGQVSSYDNATGAIETVETALSKVSAQRSELGALQNRLEHTIANADNTAENIQSAESLIRDTDMAAEMVNYSKNNILAQAGQSMLAQANQSNQGVLSLLG